MDNFEVGIHDWNDNVVRTHMGTLIAWKGALRLEAVGMEHSRGSVADHVRQFLSAPESVTVVFLADYISQCVDSISEQLGE